MKNLINVDLLHAKSASHRALILLLMRKLIITLETLKQVSYFKILFKMMFMRTQFQVKMMEVREVVRKVNLATRK